MLPTILRPAASGEPTLDEPFPSIMTTLPNLTEERIYQIAPNAKAAQSGLKLVKDQAFSQAQWSPDRTWLSARCQGSDREPYRVRVDVTRPPEPHQFDECNCSSFQRPCKHSLGLLFLALRQPELFKEKKADSWPVRLPRAEGDSPTPAVAPVAAPSPPKPAATDAQALFQLICNEPQNVAHRLIYADCLEEQPEGDGPARAEFIRIQCRLAEQPQPDPQHPLRVDERRLWEKHRKDWTADIPRHLRTQDLAFHRGFLDEMRLTVQAFLKYAGPIFDKHPFHRLRIEPPVRAMHCTQFSKSPLMSRLRELDASACDVGSPKELRLLLNTPFAGGLNRLELSRNEMTHAGLRVMLEIDYLKGLETLILAENKLGDAAAEALAQSPRLATLRTLDLRDNPLGNKGAQALAASPHLAGLERLDVTASGIGPAGAKALTERFGDRVVI